MVCNNKWSYKMKSNKILYTENGLTQMVRKCSIIDVKGTFDACYIYNIHGAKYCGLCDTDLCNGSQKLITSYWMVFTLVIGVFVKKMI